MPDFPGTDMTQRERVIQYIKDFGSITAWEAMKELGIMQLAARMCELKDEGYEFLKSTEKGTNRYGDPCHWTRYRLKDG